MLYSIIFHLLFVIVLLVLAYNILRFYNKNKMLRTVIAFLLEPKIANKEEYEKRVWLYYKESLEHELTRYLHRSCFIERPKQDFELALNLLLQFIYTDKGGLLFENKVKRILYCKDSRPSKKEKFSQLIWSAEDRVWVLYS